MNRVIDFIKNLLLDMFASVSGFIYGFLVVGFVICIGGGLIYLALFLRNILL